MRRSDKTEKAPSARAIQIPRTPRLDKHVKSTKNDKVKVITRHWLLQMYPEGTDLLQRRLREGDEAENEPLLDSDNDDVNENNGESESSSDEENENDYFDSGERDESSDVINSFLRR